MADQQVISAHGPRPEAEYLVSADQVTITGNGASDHPLVAHLTVGPPTVEHIDGSSGTVAASPTKDVSFVAAAVPQAATIVPLAAGTTDGFKKTIVLIPNQDTNWHVRPASFANGTQVNFTGAGGALTLRWNAAAASWDLVSAHGGTVV